MQKPKEKLKEKECEICGVFFEPLRSNQKYCSECRKQPERARRKMNANIKMSIHNYGYGREEKPIDNVCKNCGTHFSSWKYHKDFCTGNCREEYYISQTVCAACGKSMLSCGVHEYTQGLWFCSDSCKEAYKWEAAKQRGHIRTCSFCGKEFIRIHVKEGAATFCSNQCFQNARRAGWKHDRTEPKWAFCDYCGKMFMNPTGKENGYCSEECEKKGSVVIHKKIQPWSFQKKAPEKNEETYIQKNGLCSICKTSYSDCERMQSNFRLSPKGACFNGNLVVKCPKFTK